MQSIAKSEGLMAPVTQNANDPAPLVRKTIDRLERIVIIDNCQFLWLNLLFCCSINR